MSGKLDGIKQEICDKHADGVPVRQIAKEYGVSTTAVYYTVNPGYRERIREYNRQYQKENWEDPHMRPIVQKYKRDWAQRNRERVCEASRRYAAKKKAEMKDGVV